MNASRTLLFFSLATVVAASSCSCGNNSKRTKTTKKTQVKAESYLMDAEAFDLETVISIIKGNKVENGEALEKTINDDTGINNVDLDGDGEIDYVQVKEERPGDHVALDFRAIPSSSNDESQAETIASVKFKKNTSTNEVEVSGGYPSYVNGHHHHYYHYRSPYAGLGTAMFVAWMLTPSRPLYYRSYRPMYRTPRRVYSGGALTSKRSSYQKSVAVSPVKRASKPSSFNIQSASKTKSRFAGKKASGSSFGSRQGTMKGFDKRDGSKPRAKASGFGASKQKSTSFQSSGGKPKSGFGASSGSKKNSSFGSSSGSKKKSSFGSSGGSKKKSSSWGSSSGSKKSSFGSSSSSRSRSRSSGSRRRR